MKIYALAAVAALSALAACAERPEAIAPAYVSPVVYQDWTCQQLGEEEARLNTAYVTAAGQQNNARANDTAGVIFLGLPTASMAGENVAPQIASIKGQQDAVRQTENRKNCGR